jgi:hypothetical protein
VGGVDGILRSFGTGQATFIFSTSQDGWGLLTENNLCSSSLDGHNSLNNQGRELDIREKALQFKDISDETEICLHLYRIVYEWVRKVQSELYVRCCFVVAEK